MSLLLNGLFSFVAFLLVLGVLVIVHEFGHYLAGRLQGFGIEAFSVGFGPKVFEVKGGYNLWQFRWLLFGGYVKFRGEVREEQEPDPTPHGPGELFYRKGRMQRFVVLIMGVVFNVLLAYLLFAGLAWVGVGESVLRDQPPKIGWVAPGSPAEKAGIRPGDVIQSLDGRAVHNWQQAQDTIYMFTEKPYAVGVLRDGARMKFTVTPRTDEMLHQPVGDIGVIPAVPAVIGAVYEPSAAYDAGLRPGDRVVSIDGQALTYWDQLQKVLREGGEKEHHLVLERAGKTVAVDVTPRFEKESKRYIIGIAPQDSVWVRYPFPSCFAKAGQISVTMSTLVFRTIQGLFERKVALSSLSGPVSIAYITGQAARAGLYPLLWLLAVISLQLGLFNILPIPALDGGQIFVLLIEGILRRDLPMIVKERILQIGFALVILLFAAVLVLDTAKFFR